MPQPDSGDNCCDCPSRTSPCDDCGTGTTGACCINGVCSILSESDCTGGGGNYLGDDTTCDGVDCTQGACCFDTSCIVFTPSDCSDDGGIYQGDGTTCSPNPCCGGTDVCDCAFEGFNETGNFYLVRTEHSIRTAHVEQSGGSDGCDVSLDITKVTTTILGESCECSAEVSCSGSVTSSSPGDPGYGATCSYVSDGFGGCTFVRTSGSGSCNPLCLGACTGCSETPDSDTEASCDCDFSDPTTPANVAHYEKTVTLSNQCFVGMFPPP